MLLKRIFLDSVFKVLSLVLFAALHFPSYLILQNIRLMAAPIFINTWNLKLFQVNAKCICFKFIPCLMKYFQMEKFDRELWFVASQRQNKKEFQLDAYRPLANRSCFSSHYMLVPVGASPSEQV